MAHLKENQFIKYGNYSFLLCWLVDADALKVNFTHNSTIQSPFNNSDQLSSWSSITLDETRVKNTLNTTNFLKLNIFFVTFFTVMNELNETCNPHKNGKRLLALFTFREITKYST